MLSLVGLWVALLLRFFALAASLRAWRLRAGRIGFRRGFFDGRPVGVAERPVDPDSGRWAALLLLFFALAAFLLPWGLRAGRPEDGRGIVDGRPVGVADRPAQPLEGLPVVARPVARRGAVAGFVAGGVVHLGVGRLGVLGGAVVDDGEGLIDDGSRLKE